MLSGSKFSQVKRLIRLTSFKRFSSDFFYQFGKKDSNDLNLKGEILSSDFSEGLKFAFKNFLQAVHENDHEYISENTEREFGKKVIKNIKDYKGKLYIYPEDEEQIRILINGMKFDLHLCVEADRESNKKNGVSKLPSSVGEMMSKMMRINISNENNPFKEGLSFYQAKTITFPPMMTSVARFHIEFNSNLILSKKAASDQQEEKHSVTFDVQGKTPFDLLSTFNKSFMKNAPVPIQANPPEKIIISDFDNCMQGNPLV